MAATLVGKSRSNGFQTCMRMLLNIAVGCTAALAPIGVTVELNSITKVAMPVLLSMPRACKSLQDRHDQLSSLLWLHS